MSFVLRLSEEQLAAHQRRVAEARKVMLLDCDEDRAARERAKSLLAAEKASARRKAKPARKWGYEDSLAEQLRAAGIHRFVREFHWLPGRKFRADLGFELDHLLVEVQGQCHRIRSKFDRDILRTQEALLAGWRVLPIAPSQVKDGSAVGIIRRALEAR